MTIVRNARSAGAQSARRIFEKFLDDHGFRKAASLAYTTLFSLIPFLAVAFSLFHAFGGLKIMEGRIRELLFTHLIVDSSLEVVEYLNRFLAGINAKTISALGVVTLVLTSASLLNAVASTFNEVWQVKERRSVQTRFTTFFTLIVLTPLLFAISISATAQLDPSRLFWFLPYSRFFGGLFFLVLPLLFTWSGFTLMYLVMPSTRVHRKAAIVAGLIAAVLWEFSKLGFDVYVTRVVSYSKIYGALGIIPVFLSWIYVGWVIALFGAEVAFELQHGARVGAPVEEPRHEFAIRVLAGVASMFEELRRPLTLREMDRRFGMAGEALPSALRALERHGFIARVAGSEKVYLPARPLAPIPLDEVARAVGGLAPAPGSGIDRLGQLLAEADEASLNLLAKTTIGDLIDRDRRSS